MEVLVILFVIFIFLWLASPEKKGSPPSAGDKLMDGLKAAAKELKKELSDGGDSPGGDKKGDANWDPLLVALASIFIGLMYTYFVM